MAFTSSILVQTVFGDKRVTFGTFTNSDNSTGGELDVGLRTAEALVVTPTSTSELVAEGLVLVKEDFPCSGRAITLSTSANVNGSWIAVGH